MKKIALALIAIASSTTALAQEEQSSTPGSWEFGLGLGQTTIDQEAAADQLIGEDAFNVSLTAMYLKNSWISTVGLDIVQYDDNAGFSQAVTSNFGGDSTEDSSATGVLLTAAFGYRWTHLEDDAVSTYLQGGVSAMTSSSRGIDNCSNCYSEDIEISGGGFIRGGAHYSWSSVGLGLEYTQYMSGDLNDSLMLNLTTSFK